MSNNTVALPAELADTIWAITPESFRALALEAAEQHHDDDGPDKPLAARLQRAQGGGGAVAVIPVMGRITPRPSYSFFGGSSGGLTTLRAMLAEAAGDEQVGSIVLEVDSPGGVVDGVPETAAAIRALRDVKPVVAIANTYAASAAYWLASQATELVVSPSGSVGSIGVFIAHTDYSKMDERIGLTTTLIHAGKDKVLGNPYEPLSDAAREMFQDRVDDYYAMFVSDVARGRDTTDKVVRSESFGQGRMLLAADAVANGMADHVGTMADAVSRAARLGSKRRTTSAADPAPAPPQAADPPPTPPDLDLSQPHVRELLRDRMASSQP